MKKLVECKSLPCRLTEKTARKLDEIIKTLPSGCNYVRKSYTPLDVQFEPNERAEVSIITTATVDKSNEVVLPDGLDLSTFNGTVLYNHDGDAIVGNCTWIKLYEKDNTIRAKTEYFENTDSIVSKWYKFVDEIWTMVKAGALKAKSIGFQPTMPLREPTADELAQHPEWAGAGIWEKAILLEYSVCPVGVNSDALVEAIAKSMSPEAAKVLGLPETKNDLAELIAFVKSHAKAYKKPVKKKKSLEMQIAEALEGVDIDLDRIVNQAVLNYKNRGRV